MRTPELKSDLHKIVDRIESKELLSTIYNFLKERENAKEGEIWNSLSEDQKEEVLKAYEESEDDSNLINDEDVWTKFE